MMEVIEFSIEENSFRSSRLENDSGRVVVLESQNIKLSVAYCIRLVSCE